MFRIVLLFTLFFASTFLHADSSSNNSPQEDRKLKVYLGAGYDYGGDDLLKIKFNSGVSQKLQAGTGLSFSIGAQYHPSERYMARATLGYKFDAITADNGDADISRTTLELAGYRFWGKHGIGAGLVQHKNIDLSCKITNVCSGSISFDDASGVLIEYLFRGEGTRAGLLFGVRTIQNMEYKSAGGSADADSIGLAIGMFF